MEMKKMVRDLPWVLIGNFMLALAVAMFILPYNILSGGVAGIAVALQPVFHIEPTLMVNALVLGMFVLGTLFLGKSFAVKTVIQLAGVSGLSDDHHTVCSAAAAGSDPGVALRRTAGGRRHRAGAADQVRVPEGWTFRR